MRFILSTMLLLTTSLAMAERPRPPYLVCMGGIRTYLCVPATGHCYYVGDGCGGSAARTNSACSIELGSERSLADEIVSGNAEWGKTLAKIFRSYSREEYRRMNSFAPAFDFQLAGTDLVITKEGQTTKIPTCELRLAPSTLSDLGYGFLMLRK